MARGRLRAMGAERRREADARRDEARVFRRMLGGLSAEAEAAAAEGPGAAPPDEPAEASG